MSANTQQTTETAPGDGGNLGHRHQLTRLRETLDELAKKIRTEVNRGFFTLVAVTRRSEYDGAEGRGATQVRVASTRTMTRRNEGRRPSGH